MTESPRTTVRLPHDLLRVAKTRAAERGTTLTRRIEEAQRESLARHRRAPTVAEPVRIVTVGGSGVQRVFREPSPLERATAFVGQLRVRPQCVVVSPFRTSLLALSAMGAAVLSAAPAPGQEPPTPAEIERVRVVHRAVSAVVEALGDGLWPDFRPRRWPVLYTGLRGAVLLDWKGEPPPGFRKLEGLDGAAWSTRPPFGALLAERTTLTSLDDAYSLPGATALAVHEHFHAHQRAAVERGAAFGRGERPRDVRLYPVFDTVNAALLALEGRLLAAAIRAGTDAGLAKARVREFLAVRERRRAPLGPAVAAWERGAERNEGLADYAALRALGWLSETDHRRWGKEARSEADRRLSRLDRLVALADSSLRRRFYATGSAQALLLDRLAPGWKGRMVAGGSGLEEMLAAAVAYPAAARGDPYARAARREGLTALRRAAGAFLAALAERRRATADSLLGLPGLRVTLAGGERAVVCGLDPLNLRHVDGDRVIHTGFLRVCSEDEDFAATYGGSTVERVGDGAFAIVAGDPEEVTVRAAGSDLAPPDLEAPRTVESLEIEAPNLSLRAERARIRRTGRVLTVEPLPGAAGRESPDLAGEPVHAQSRQRGTAPLL